MTLAKFTQRMRSQICSVGEWSHLVPLERPLADKTIGGVSNPLRRGLRSIQSQVRNARSYFRIHAAQQGFSEAAKSTTRQIGRVMSQMLQDKQRQSVLLGNFASSTVPSIQRSPWVDNWHDDATSNEPVTVSAIIPTKNAGPEIRPLLALLRSQKGFRKVEIIVVDSGSTDDTLRIARQAGAKIVEIAPADFSHSYARNIGAEQSSGDCVLFMVQDALPPSMTWLWELYQPIRFGEVVASSCAESPRHNADLMYRTICWIHQGFLELRGQDRILQKPKRNDYASLRANANVSDIACLIRREIFLNYRFRGDYAEDLDLGLRLIRDGHKMALLSSTRVIHSHNRPAYYHLKRAYVDTLFIRRVFPDHDYLPVDAATLIQEIVLIYDRLNELSAGKLGPSLAPCSMTTLCTTVTDALAEPAFGLQSARIPPECSSVDEPFHAFVQSLYSRCGHALADGKPSGAVLLALRAFVTKMLEYMQGIYERVDEPLLEDFRKSLFKAFAFNCGLLLATGVATGSASTREILQDVCVDLKHSI